MNKLKNHFAKYGNTYIFGLGILLGLALFVWLFFLTDYLKNFLLWLQTFVQNHTEYAYLVAFIAAIVEGTIFLGALPGTTYVITMGVFLARGDVEWYWIFPLIIAGGFIGDSTGYFLGKLFSNKLAKKYSKESMYILAQDFIKKHGGKSILFARFISGIKEFVPFIAGIMKMPFKKFAFWNFLGAIGWALFWVGLGWGLGSVVESIENITRTVGTAFLIFFLISAYLYWRKNKDKLSLENFGEEFLDEI